jgi:hypothetical protein
MLAVSAHRGSAAKHVVATLRLGHGKREERLATGDSLEPALTRVLGANPGDGVTDGRGEDRHPQDEVRLGECLHHDHIGEQSTLGSAVRGGHEQTGPATIADLLP